MSRSTTDRGEAIIYLPAPQFSPTFLAGHWSNPQSAPVGQPDPSTVMVERLRWGRGADDGHWHLLAPHQCHARQHRRPRTCTVRPAGSR